MFLILCGYPRLNLQEGLLFEVYCDVLWNAAYQHDLNNAAGKNKRQAFISQKVVSFDESERDLREDTPLDQDEDDSSPYSIFQSSFNSPEPQKPTKIFIPSQLWGEFPEAAKKLIIEHNKKVKVVIPKPFIGNPKPKPTLGKPNPKLQQVHLHENDHPLKILLLKSLLKPWCMSA